MEFQIFHNKFLCFAAINCAGRGGLMLNEKTFLKGKILRSWGDYFNNKEDNLKDRFNLK